MMADYSINQNVYRLKQPDSSTCWAACLAMKLEAAGRKCYSVEGIKSKARDGGVKFESDGTLKVDTDNMYDLGDVFNLRVMRNRGTVRISDIAPYLRRSPIILFGGFKYDGVHTPMNHAVLLTGLFGDGSGDTGVSLVDPQNTQNGSNGESDIVCSWDNLCNDVIDRLDFMTALR